MEAESTPNFDVNKVTDVCLNPDKNDDKLPLELRSALLSSIHKITDDDGSVLHMCVRCDNLEALKFIMQSMRGEQEELLNAKDKDGNTALHLAVRLQQIQITKYLLSLPGMRTTANTLNKKDQTALDILELCPRDLTCLTIEHILTEAGVQRTEHTPPQLASTTESSGEPSKKLENFCLKYLQYQGNWIEETRGMLMVVATVIATMTFQSALNPPGGVWQENTRTGVHTCATRGGGMCQAGTSIVGYDWSKDYVIFITFNTVSFFASLCVVLVLISGFPLKNKVIMWVLTVAMTVAVTFMLFTYLWAIGLVTPYHIYCKAYWMGYVFGAAWITILVVVGLIHAARIVFWMKKRQCDAPNQLEVV